MGALVGRGGQQELPVQIPLLERQDETVGKDHLLHKQAPESVRELLRRPAPSGVNLGPDVPVRHVQTLMGLDPVRRQRVPDSLVDTLDMDRCHRAHPQIHRIRGALESALRVQGHSRQETGQDED